VTGYIVAGQSRVGSKPDRFYRQRFSKIGDAFPHQVSTIAQNLTRATFKFLTH